MSSPTSSTFMISSSFPILIVGGGIGGLTAACLFGQKGIPVVVLEQRPFESLETGFGLQLSPNATRILYDLGIGSAVQPFAYEPRLLSIQNLQPSWGSHSIASMSFEDSKKTYGFPYWTIRRRDLHRILHKQASTLPSVTLYSNHTCETFHIQENTVHVTAQTCSGKRTFSGQMIIGADGIHSRVRDWIYGVSGIRLSGMSAFRQVLSTCNLPAPWTTNSGLWLDPHHHIVHYPLGNTKKDINVVIVQKTYGSREHQHPSQIKKEKLPQALHWLSPFLTLDTLWHPHTLYISTQKTPRWGSPQHQTVLLGDSAHPILPFLAQGAALALEDAYALVQSFYKSNGDFSSFFEDYTRTRDSRTRFITRRTLFTGRMYHMHSALTPFRNLGMALLGSKGLQRLQRPIYAFKSQI